MNKKVLLWFDVEDYITPEAEDALYELLKTLDESGVRATLKLTTIKYAQLLENGRKDILRLMSNHEIAFHMTDHSVHPLPSEYLDYLGFVEGAEAFDRKEGPGYEKLRQMCGQYPTSYGHPGVAWAPQVFPALRKWGVLTYLDAHDIVNVDGQPFWYGGVLCHTKLNNLSHLVKDGSTDSMIRQFDNMDTTCTDTVFMSIYDHPHELCCSEFWDEINFADGLNPPYYKPAALRTIEERNGLINQYRAFVDHAAGSPDTEFVTALESLRYEKQRFQPITADLLKAALEEAGTEANYLLIGGAYCTASEVLGLMARQLTGRLLTPEMLYGPESHQKSVVNGKVNVKALAEAVYHTANPVFGYKQLPELYRVGDNFINPVDAYAMLAKAILTGTEEVEFVEGKLLPVKHVDHNFKFGGGNWPLWKPDFKAEHIFEQTELQTWTLRPAIF